MVGERSEVDEQVPFAKSSATARASASARRDFPLPPAPARVTRRASSVTSRVNSSSSRSRPIRRFGGTGSCGRLGWVLRPARVVAEDRPFQLAKLRAGLQAELLAGAAGARRGRCPARLPAVRSGRAPASAAREAAREAGASRAGPQLGEASSCRPTATSAASRSSCATSRSSSRRRASSRAKPSSATSASAEPRHRASARPKSADASGAFPRTAPCGLPRAGARTASRRALRRVPGARSRAPRSRSAARARACAAARRRHGPPVALAGGRPGHRASTRRSAETTSFARSSSAASSADASPHRVARTAVGDHLDRAQNAESHAGRSLR